MENEAYPFFFPGQEIPLPCELINCGHEFVQSKTYRHHGLQRGTREFFIWQYTLSGTGALRVGDKGRAIAFASEDCAFVIPDIETYIGRSLPITQPSDEMLVMPPEALHAGTPRGQARKPDAFPHHRKW